MLTQTADQAGRRAWRSLALAVCLTTFLPIAVFATESVSSRTETTEEALEEVLAERWGIRVESLRLTVADYMLDFRYRVLDPQKARELFLRANKPVLIHQASKERFIVPAPGKVGPMRSSYQPQADRVYAMLFANPAKYIKRGDKVTVEIGEFRVLDVVVE